jgi:two-component system chemotaxis response regulator CheY
MKSLIVEDDFICRKLLQNLLAPFGETDIAVNGVEAVQAFELALGSGKPYDLVCMDIMMPEMDGQAALQRIRAMEKEHGRTGAKESKVIMVTALDDAKNVVAAYYKGGATSYIPKPIDNKKLVELLRELKLI